MFIKLIRYTILLVFAGLATHVNALSFPPSPSDWSNLEASRQDPTPLNITQLQQQPTIGGAIIPSEWIGATSYPVSSSDGTLLFGTYNNFLYTAFDATSNTNSDPVLNGGNAWRVGTSKAQGPGNSGNSNWFEIYVKNDGTTNTVQARIAPNEADLNTAPWNNAADFGIDASAFFNGTNWQYLLAFNPGVGIAGGPGSLLPSFQWPVQQVDPIVNSGTWEPVFNGSIHVPESGTGTLILLSGVLALVGKRWRRCLAAKYLA